MEGIVVGKDHDYFCLRSYWNAPDDVDGKIYFGEMENAVYNTSLYFKNRFKPHWMSEERTVKMIKDVDKSDVLGNGAVSSPVMGIIAPVSLSGGVKTLILIDQINDNNLIKKNLPFEVGVYFLN